MRYYPVSRLATTREVRRAGTHCWLQDSVQFELPDGLTHHQRATFLGKSPHFGHIAAEVDGVTFYMDVRCIDFPDEYQTKKGRWIPESDPRVRPYLVYQLFHTRTWRVTQSMRGHQIDQIAKWKWILARNGWAMPDEQGDDWGDDYPELRHSS